MFARIQAHIDTCQEVVDDMYEAAETPEQRRFEGIVLGECVACERWCSISVYSRMCQGCVLDVQMGVGA